MAYINDITFLEIIHSSSNSQVSCVIHHGRKYCLKLFHMRKTSEFAALAFPGRELCRFRCEVKAYQALQKHGVCERGHVPRFYDSFTELDPTRFSPHLDAFLNDEIYPSAILLEYLPNAQQLHCVNYSEERMKRAVAGIRDIHSAHVEHNDASPKHILIVLEGEGNLERIVWIDLDVSTVYSVAGNENSDLKVREERRLRFEVECVESLGRLLKQDQEEGLPAYANFY